MFRKRRGQQEMSWATIVDFYARLREVTEIIGSHHDKLLGGPGVCYPIFEPLGMQNRDGIKGNGCPSDDDDEVPLSMMSDGDSNWEEFKERLLLRRETGKHLFTY
ncbi:hypothetical protein TNIN_209561 [Trichonephila inaurata madagascariensis]|uniref:Uncharacterized protein n=1 Tax=Trichonephila inaurata madagascariensis TaxID=2747483 RepID=A0A8X6XVL0_9ARAC|nr:hypothetical protein TNIN_209561 [Trichonephila inaurata madagascariensis]